MLQMQVGHKTQQLAQMLRLREGKFTGLLSQAAAEERALPRSSYSSSAQVLLQSVRVSQA